MSKSKYTFGREANDNEFVAIPLKDLNALIDLADSALDGNSNDAEHDALYNLRETLADWSQEPEARLDWKASNEK
jgi:hypothetical protein